MGEEWREEEWRLEGRKRKIGVRRFLEKKFGAKISWRMEERMTWTKRGEEVGGR